MHEHKHTATKTVARRGEYTNINWFLNIPVRNVLLRLCSLFAFFALSMLGDFLADLLLLAALSTQICTNKNFKYNIEKKNAQNTVHAHIRTHTHTRAANTSRQTRENLSDNRDITVLYFSTRRVSDGHIGRTERQMPR